LFHGISRGEDFSGNKKSIATLHCDVIVNFIRRTGGLYIVRRGWWNTGRACATGGRLSSPCLFRRPNSAQASQEHVRELRETGPRWSQRWNPRPSCSLIFQQISGVCSSLKGASHRSKGCCFDTVWYGPDCELLRGAADGSLPAEQEKVTATESAPVRLKKPVDHFFHGVSYAYASKINRFAIGTARGHNLPKRRPWPGCVRRRRRVFEETASRLVHESIRSGRRQNGQVLWP